MESWIMGKKDRDGVVELPFKLVIAGIIVIFTMSIAYSGLQKFSENNLRDRVEASVDDIVAAAGDVGTMGLNSSVKVKVDLSSTMFHRVESFVVGCGADEETHLCKGVEYKISGFRSKWQVAKDNTGHDIVFKGKDHRIKLGEGVHEIMLMKCPDHLQVTKV